jgi:hypothetical protein
MHGYGIAIRIQQISVEVFQVNPGSLFPAFNRLELPATFTRVGQRQSAAITRILEA